MPVNNETLFIINLAKDLYTFKDFNTVDNPAQEAQKTIQYAQMFWDALPEEYKDTIRSSAETRTVTIDGQPISVKVEGGGGPTSV